MRHVGNFNPEWGYLAPAPSLLRTARVFVVAVVIGATTSAAVVFSLMDRPTAEPSVAARTLVLSADPSQAAPDAQAMRQQTAHSARRVQTPTSESPGQSHPNIAVAAHASTAPAAESAALPTPQRPTAAAGLVEAPAITAAEPPPLQALVRENPAAPTAAEAAPASPPTPALKGGIKKPRAVARAAVPPRYDVPRYAAPRFEPRHEAMQRGPYAFLRQYGSFGQEY